MDRPYLAGRLVRRLLNRKNRHARKRRRLPAGFHEVYRDEIALDSFAQEKRDAREALRVHTPENARLWCWAKVGETT